jgi:aerobic C4-dicarboxylate transport protein
MHIVPNTVVGAFAEGEILQVLFFAVLFAFALHALGEHGKPLIRLVDQTAHAFFKIVGFVMKVAPIGAFGAMAFTIGRYGVGTLLSLGQLMACFYITCLIFVLGVLGVVGWLCGFNILKFIRYIKEELLIVLGTSSSESVLPRMLAKMENLGCDKSVVGLVIPTGYSFNLDGTCIYLTMAAVFLAQATNTDLSLGQELGLIGILLLTSKGAAGVTGSGFIVLAATLSSLGTVPVASIALILGVDRFMSEARALTNLVGNSVATVVVAKWEGALDHARLRRQLDREADAEADNPEDMLVAGDIMEEGGTATPADRHLRPSPRPAE